LFLRLFLDLDIDLGIGIGSNKLCLVLVLLLLLSTTLDSLDKLGEARCLPVLANDLVCDLELVGGFTFFVPPRVPLILRLNSLYLDCDLDK